MFLAPVDKKTQIKGRIRETSTIGASKEKNKIAIPEELAKARGVGEVHTRIVLEDGHFYLESAGGATYVGIPKKKFFQVRAGDKLMLGQARCSISALLPFTFLPLDGIIDHMMGKMPLATYNVKILGSGATIEQRLRIARGEDLEA